MTQLPTFLQREPSGRRLSQRSAILTCLLVMIVFTAMGATMLPAQNPEIDAAAIQDIMNAEDAGDGADPTAQGPTDIGLVSLIMSGGRFMIPIGLMSLLVVTLAVERMVALRHGKILPHRLVRELDELSNPISRFNPSMAYDVCLDNPSPTARVIGAMLLRTGQPLGDIERTASETVQREADRFSAPIRWLNLAAAATPLMGLLGTVWGMIVAFHESTTLVAGRSRSEQLSEGIYTALVTTLAGLIVAIPAAIFAQYLENRVVKLFHQIEQIAFDIAPGLARFTNRRRLDVDGSLYNIEPSPTGAKSPKPPPPPPPRPGSKKRAKTS